MKEVKLNRKIIQLITAIALIAILNFSCKEYKEKDMSENTSKIFTKGELVPSEFFTGNAWNKRLVPDDSIFTTTVGNVVFEAGARSNWHSHPGGQILLVTDGVGYHQIKGEPIQIIKRGDVVKCPPNVIHWHGASRVSGMTHIYIVPNTENGIVNWMEAVTDEEYRRL